MIQVIWLNILPMNNIAYVYSFIQIHLTRDIYGQNDEKFFHFHLYLNQTHGGYARSIYL